MILSVNGLSKRFDGLQALSDVSFNLEEKEILGLIGPNGAGKTTMFNCINGVYPPTEGTVKFLGEETTAMKTYFMAKKGLARTHQIVKPMNELTVLENVMIGACFGSDGLNLKKAAIITEEVLDFLRIGDRSEQLAGSLNVGQKKRLEIARALASGPKLLLLDEVLAGLNPSEITEMVNTVKEIREQGISIIMIEHVMHAIMNVSDRIIVLDYGKLIAAGTPSEIANNEQVIEAYLGDPKLAEKLMQTSS
jgi:branched-chain amino acid transport system ATP-binding protein